MHNIVIDMGQHTSDKVVVMLVEAISAQKPVKRTTDSFDPDVYADYARLLWQVVSELEVETEPGHLFHPVQHECLERLDDMWMSASEHPYVEMLDGFIIVHDSDEWDVDVTKDDLLL